MSDGATGVVLEAQELRFEFVSAYWVEGFSLPPSESRVQWQHPDGTTSDSADTRLEIPTSQSDVSVQFVADPTPFFRDVDRRTALASMMLRAAFQGQRPADAASLAVIDEEVKTVAAARAKGFPIPGCYLMVRVAGSLKSNRTDVARDVGAFVVAFDAIDKAAVCGRFRPLVQAFVAATALATSDRVSARVSSFGEGVALWLRDARPLYSMTAQGGQVHLALSRPVAPSDCIAVGKGANALIQSAGHLESPVRLMVDALSRERSQRLESFLLGWAGLEMLVRKCTDDVESGDWVDRVPAGVLQSAALEIHERFAEQSNGGRRYPLADRVRAFCLERGREDWEVVATAVNRMRKQHREPLYHEGKLSEDGLPVEELMGLCRLLLGMQVQTGDI